MRSEILGLVVHTLTANYEYSGSNRENLPLPIQIKLSKNRRTFAVFFLFFFVHFWYLFESSNVLKKNMSLIGQLFLKLLTPKDVLI